MTTANPGSADECQTKPEMIREFKIIAGPFSGTYGEVRIGEHVLLHNKRAFKKLHLHVQPEVIKQEAQKQMSVKSPYVAQIYDYYDEQGGIIAMEYCPTGFEQYLRDRLHQTKSKIPYEEARPLLSGILQGLNDAHRADVIHGDIKPSNVRIGEDQLPKLCDFGAATRARETTPVIRGSTNWMAPDVLAGGRPSKESDYFSFGILAYLVLTGRHPFYADDPSCLTSEEDNIRAVTFKPPLLWFLRKDIPVQVAQLVMTLLSRDQDRVSAELSLKAAMSEPFQATMQPPTPVGVVEGMPTDEEVKLVKADLENAKWLFFVTYRPYDAVLAIELLMQKIDWGRFKGKNVPLLADCWSLRAYINNSGGRFDDAVTAATNGLSVQENHVSSLHARGYAYIQKGMYVEAEEDLRKALEYVTDARKREQVEMLLNTVMVRRERASAVRSHGS